MYHRHFMLPLLGFLAVAHPLNAQTGPEIVRGLVSLYEQQHTNRWVTWEVEQITTTTQDMRDAELAGIQREIDNLASTPNPDRLEKANWLNHLESTKKLPLIDKSLIEVECKFRSPGTWRIKYSPSHIKYIPVYQEIIADGSGKACAVNYGQRTQDFYPSDRVPLCDVLRNDISAIVMSDLEQLEAGDFQMKRESGKLMLTYASKALRWNCVLLLDPNSLAVTEFSQYSGDDIPKLMSRTRIISDKEVIYELFYNDNSVLSKQHWKLKDTTALGTGPDSDFTIPIVDNFLLGIPKYKDGRDGYFNYFPAKEFKEKYAEFNSK